MLTNIIVAVIALIFSALFSGYEMAFLHCNRLKIALDKKEGLKYAIAMDKYIKNEADFISSLLVGNNIVLVIYSIAVAKILDPFISEYITQSLSLILVIDTVIAAIIVLITGEFLPKSICFLNPNGVIKSLYRLMIFFYYIFYPITWITNIIAKFIIKKIWRKQKFETENAQNAFTETDLINLSEEIEDSINQDDGTLSDIEIFQNAVDFSSTKIKECLIPRTEISAIDIDSTISELLQMFIDTGYSRIPVYKENIDNIVGYVLCKDLFNKQKDLQTAIEGFIRPIKHVQMDMEAQVLLELMTSHKETIVAVSDEWGGTEGIITLEDLIEEIFGEINDELDNENFIEKKISEKEYIFSARLEVKDLNKKYNFNLPENPAYETLAGLIINTAETLPKEKETLHIGNISLTILKSSKRRIEIVSLVIS